MMSRRVENTVCLSISVARLRELLSNGDLRVCLLATEKQALRWLIACDFDEESPVRVLSRSTSGVVLMANGYTSRVPAWVARVTLIHRIGVVTRHP